ncbi:MAG: hypothetical protein R3A44_20575 [Caldilineaceae bacterium]
MENDKSTSQESKNSTGSEGSASVGGQELMDELGRLGARFMELAQAAWASDERKRMEADLRKGLNSVVESLEEGFERIRASEQTKESMAKAKDVADDITERVSRSETAHELADGLMQGLRMLGERLEKWTAEFSKDQPAADASAAAEQDIPVQDISGQEDDA